MREDGGGEREGRFARKRKRVREEQRCKKVQLMRMKAQRFERILCRSLGFAGVDVECMVEVPSR